MKIACIGLLLLLGQDPPKTPLEWGWAKDAKLRYDFAMAVDVDAGGLPMKQDLVLGLAWTVKAVGDDGAAEIAVLIDRVKIVMNGFVETEYDSDVDAEPDASPVAEFMAALVDRRFALKISKRGEVLQVKGLADAMKAAAEGQEKGANMMLANLKKMLSEKQVKGMLQQLVVLLPEKPVAAGEAWPGSVSWSVPLLGTLKLESESTIKEFAKEGREAVIKVKIKADSVADEDNLSEVSELEARGNARWNVAEKRLTASECFLAMKVNFNGQDCPISMATTLAWSPREAKERPKKPAPKPRPREE